MQRKAGSTDPKPSRSCNLFPMFSRRQGRLDRREIKPEKPETFDDLQQKIAAIKTRFGAEKDGFIGQAIFYFFQSILYERCNFKNNYWVGPRHKYKYENTFQIKDLAPEGRPGYVSIGYACDKHSPDEKARLEDLVDRTIVVDVDITETSLVMSYDGLSHVLRRVEFQLSQNPYNYPGSVIMQALTPLHRDEQNRQISIETVFFETLEELYYSLLLNQSSRKFLELISCMQTEWKVFPAPILQLIFAYAFDTYSCKHWHGHTEHPLWNISWHAASIPYFSASHSVQFSFSQDTPIKMDITPGNSLIINGKIKNPYFITAVFNEIMPNSSAYFAYTQYQVVVLNKVLLHPIFLNTYTEIARKKRSPTALTAFGFFHQLANFQSKSVGNYHESKAGNAHYPSLLRR